MCVLIETTLFDFVRKFGVLFTQIENPATVFDTADDFRARERTELKLSCGYLQNLQDFRFPFIRLKEPTAVPLLPIPWINHDAQIQIALRLIGILGSASEHNDSMNFGIVAGPNRNWLCEQVEIKSLQVGVGL